MEVHVSFGDKFWTNVLRDYSNWRFAIIRELIQNGVDCGSKQIAIKITEEGDRTILEVGNDGTLMTREILLGKLFCLGETGKSASDVGGMGEAKRLIYMAQAGFVLQTGHLKIVGVHEKLDISEVETFVDGTYNRIIIVGLHGEALRNAVHRWASFSYWRGTIVLDGDELRPISNENTIKKQWSWGRISETKRFTGVAVRAGGQLMFHQYHQYRRGLIVELIGDTKTLLTANRDSLKSSAAAELTDFLGKLAVDPMSAWRDIPLEKKEVRFFAGTGKTAVLTRAEAESQVQRSLSDGMLIAAAAQTCTPVTIHGPGAEVLDRAAPVLSNANFRTPQQVLDQPDLIVKSNTGMAIPDYCVPPTLSHYAASLLAWYRNCLVRWYELLQLSGAFRVGFILDDDRIGEFERTTEYGDVYYINPCEIATQSKSKSRSYRKRFDLSLEGKSQIVATAGHEVLHGGVALSYHNEEFALKLTDLLVILYAKRTAFNDCFVTR